MSLVKAVFSPSTVEYFWATFCVYPNTVSRDWLVEIFDYVSEQYINLNYKAPQKVYEYRLI